MAGRRALHVAGLVAGLAALGAGGAWASDHIDGSGAVNRPTADLTDLFAFTAGDGSGRLVVILNAVTAAQPWESPATEATFDIVIGAIADETLALLPDPRFRLNCNWTETAAVCDTSTGARIEAPLGVIADPAPLRLFAGRRSDPFVLNGIWAGELALRDAIPTPFDANILEGFNVFALVAEIDIAAVMPELAGRALAIGAEVRVRDGGPILDRLGRPEIANIALQSNTGPDLRDALNSHPALGLPDPFRSTLRTRLRENLDRYDAMDPAPYAVDKDALAAILTEDFLAIDPRLPCTGARYFDLEGTLLAGMPATRCGGRPLGQDVIDAVYGLMILGDASLEIADGAATPTQPPAGAFPWLAVPNTGAVATLQAIAGRGISDLSAPGQGRLVMAAILGALGIGLVFVARAAVRRIRRRR